MAEEGRGGSVKGGGRGGGGLFEGKGWKGREERKSHTQINFLDA